MGISFSEPQRLWWILVAVLVLVLLEVYIRRRKVQGSKRFTNLSLLEESERAVGRSWTTYGPLAVLVLAVSVFIAQWAEPLAETEEQTESAALMYLTDCSDSMGADDVSPTRFDAVKSAVLGSVDTAPDALKLGVVCYNNNTGQLTEPTDNRLLIKERVSNLYTEAGGTDIGGAISAGIAQVKQLYPDDDTPPAALVLLSDGAPRNQSVDESVAAQAAADAGIPIHTVAFGTPTGTLTVMIDGEPTQQPVPPEPAVLEEISAATGGRFFESADSADLESIYNGVIAEISTEIVKEPIHWGFPLAFGLLMTSYIWARLRRKTMW